MSDLSSENRNDADEATKRARLASTLSRMKRNNPGTFKELKPETPELRNTTINPRLLSQPWAETSSPSPSPEPYTPTPSPSFQERVEIKKEEHRSQNVQDQLKMQNLQNILKRTRDNPNDRRQREEQERQRQLQQYQKQKDSETMYLMILVGGFFLYHYLKK